MNDGVIDVSKVIAGCLWVWALCLLAAAWIVAWQGPSLVAGLLAATACASSAVAATAQIRVYSMAVCRQLRVMRADIDRVRAESPGLRGL